MLLNTGLLLQGDNLVELVVLCADKPTHTLLTRVAKELPIQLNVVSEEHKYNVSLAPTDGAVLVTDGTVTVKVSLTSPLLREPQGIFQSFFNRIFFLYFVCGELILNGGTLLLANNHLMPSNDFTIH